VGDYQDVRSRVGGWGMFDYVLSGIVAVLLLVYLGWAMFRPEKF
jgi:K+-transporting ATPase KdpF subunit